MIFPTDSQIVQNGSAFAESAARMTTLPVRDIRRKAVWGPKRTAFALLFLALGFSSSAIAQDQGNSDASSSASTARSGRPHSRVTRYKLDAEMQRRRNTNPSERSSVIVTLVPGTQLPPQFKRFARRGNLNIINGQVLDLPNGLI